MRREYEVIIVGAGPAGSSAAAVLARRGRSVLLVDKSRFPRDKICGDGLSQRALDQLGVVGDETGAAIRPSARIRIVFGNGESHLLEDPAQQPALGTLPRITLDDYLLASLRSEPTLTLVEGSFASTVRELTAGTLELDIVTPATGETTTYKTRVIIDASGASSRIAKQFRLQSSTLPLVAIAVRGYFDGLESGALEATVVLDREVQPGYLWLFPVGDTSANVGLGLFRWKRSSHLIDVLSEQVLRNAHARILRTATLRGKFQGGIIPCLTNLASRVRSKVLFCGDAAAFADPLTAEGIPYAIQSGRLAALTVDDALTSNKIDAGVLAPYDVAWRNAFGTHLLSRKWSNSQNEPTAPNCDKSLAEASLSSDYERAFRCALRNRASFSSHASSAGY